MAKNKKSKEQLDQDFKEALTMFPHLFEGLIDATKLDDNADITSSDAKFMKEKFADFGFHGDFAPSSNELDFVKNAIISKIGKDGGDFIKSSSDSRKAQSARLMQAMERAYLRPSAKQQELMEKSDEATAGMIKADTLSEQIAAMAGVRAPTRLSDSKRFADKAEPRATQKIGSVATTASKTSSGLPDILRTLVDEKRNKDKKDTDDKAIGQGQQKIDEKRFEADTAAWYKKRADRSYEIAVTLLVEDGVAAPTAAEVAQMIRVGSTTKAAELSIGPKPKRSDYKTK